MKTGAKWMRKLHRWLSIPLMVLIPISMVLRVSGNGDVMKETPKWETSQSILILFLAISGGYLYLPVRIEAAPGAEGRACYCRGRSTRRRLIEACGRSIGARSNQPGSDICSTRAAV